MLVQVSQTYDDFLDLSLPIAPPASVRVASPPAGMRVLSSKKVRASLEFLFYAIDPCLRDVKKLANTCQSINVNLKRS